MEDIFSFGVKDIQRILRGNGLSLGDLDSVLDPDKPGRYARFSFIRKTENPWTGEESKMEVAVLIRKDQEGMFVELRYKYRSVPWVLRYNLAKKETNLKNGDYRYYLVPWSGSPLLCSKIYLSPDTGEFVPRYVLKGMGVLYADQRKSRKERYYLSSKVPGTRYRKSHYRGRITPFWRRYEYLRDREDERFIEYSIGTGLVRGLLSPKYEREVLEEYRRHCGTNSSTRERKSGKTPGNRQNRGVL